jgi:uncharacterized protein
METRFTSATEVRSAGPKRIAGRAASYGSRAEIKTKDGSSFQETIKRGAFDRILASNPDVVCLFNHNSDHVLGRTSAGTLRLEADDQGLDFECDLPNSQYARDLHESIQRRDIAGCSFAFLLDPDDDEWEQEGRTIVRSIKNFKQLIDVSCVTHPAYNDTSISARYSQHVLNGETRDRLLARGIILGSMIHPTLRKGFKVVFQSDKDAAAVVARRKNLLSQM